MKHSCLQYKSEMHYCEIRDTVLHEIVVDPSEEMGGQGAVEEQLDNIDEQADLSGADFYARERHVP